MTKHLPNFYKLLTASSDFFTHHNLRDRKLVLAVSGGIDSIVLAKTIIELKNDLNLQLVICHVNHNLRPTSAADADFVREFAKSNVIPFELYEAGAKPETENIENWAREIRYNFLNECLEKHSADFITTAHHKLDQVETFLFKLLTGRLLTDARCIRGIDLDRKLIRPFLALDKSLIDAVFKEQNLKFVQDESNFDTSRTRNLIRHDLLTQLQSEYNPNIVQTIFDTATKFSADEKLLTDLAEDLSDKIDDEVLLWRLIRQTATNQLGDDAKKLGYKAYKIVADAVLENKPQPRYFDLGLGITVKISRNKIMFSN